MLDLGLCQRQGQQWKTSCTDFRKIGKSIKNVALPKGDRVWLLPAFMFFLATLSLQDT